MKIRQATWKIKTLNSKRLKINPKPQYQRTSVWSIAKKKLFIDSILRGYDVPKFYVRATPRDPVYEYEVTDGQQRMRAIWEFMSADKHEAYSLDEAIIDGVNTKGLTYKNLGKLKERFEDYILNIALIDQASPEEVRSLFARLQMGEQLNKVELRHAMASNIGAAIISVVDTHTFFDEAKIAKGRFKHQDYLDHVVTLAYFKGGADIKAKNIEVMYKELASATSDLYQDYIRKATNILNHMENINALSKGIFRNKWAFVDTFWFLYSIYDKIKGFDYQLFVDRFKLFEQKRLQNHREPEKLIKDPALPNYDKDMYDYIMAFKYSGNTKANISIRHNVFNKQFSKAIDLK